MYVLTYLGSVGCILERVPLRVGPVVLRGLGMKVMTVQVEPVLKGKRSHSVATSFRLCFMLCSGARNVSESSC